MRIVSLVPSWTETLFRVGAGDEIVGVTLYCVRPLEAQAKQIVGGTKDPDLSLLFGLDPDLVILCREENRLDDAREIMDRTRTFVVDVHDVSSTVETIRRLGAVIDRMEETERLGSAIEGAAERSRGILSGSHVSLIWKKPMMGVGMDRYASGLMAHLGMHNVIREPGYPEIDLETLSRLDPDWILLPDEPCPWRPDRDAAYFAGLRGDTMFFEGSLLTWHGARTLDSLRRLPAILAPRPGS